MLQVALLIVPWFSFPLASFAVSGYSGTWTLTIGAPPPAFGCMDPNSDNYDADATSDDGSCSAYIGQDCAYYGYPDQSLDCDLYYCVPNSPLP